MLRPGEAIDVWIVDRPLGHGGFGSVYRCHNSSAARILAAVKVLGEELRRSEEAKARFVREAEILYGLDHPNIVQVRNVRMDGPLPYLEMEYVDGLDLERRLRRGPLPFAEALPLFEQVADALAYLHRKGVRHRDVKPGNIVVRADGSLKLVDFGIATEGHGALPGALLPSAGDDAFGSVAYAPPEWLETRGRDDARWDVYSAGLVFWEVLTGREAFPVREGAALAAEVLRVVAAKKATASLALPGFPEPLSALVADMTRAAPEARLADFDEVKARLAALRDDTRVARPTASRDSARRVLPRPVVVSAAAAPGPRAIPIPTRRRLADALRVTLVPPSEAASTAAGSSSTPAARAHVALPVPPPPPTWRSSLPGATPPRGDDPSYAVARSKRAAWIEVRWRAPARFAEWCASQLLNYTLVLPGGADVLPTSGPIRVLLSHEDVHLDCVAEVQAQGAASVSYRLDLDLPQIERLRRWLGTCAAGCGEVCL